MCTRGVQTLFFMSECDSHTVFNDTSFSSAMFSFSFENLVYSWSVEKAAPGDGFVIERR